MAEPTQSIERGEDNSLPPPYSDQIVAGIDSSLLFMSKNHL